MISPQELVELFIIDRPVLHENNQDPVRMTELLQEEVDELAEAIRMLVQGGSVEDVASECADVYWFVITISILLGFDLDESFRTKASRNVLKRPAANWQEGEYYTLDKQARTIWKASGGDKKFYSETK